MKGYQVARFNEAIDWSEVEVLTIDHYPWYKSGVKQATYVQLAQFNQALYIKVKAIDCHSSASILAINGPVYLDSCFEFFFTPDKDLSTSYINLEINCVGSVYLGVKDQQGIRIATKDEISALMVSSSLEQGRLKEVSDEDACWYLDIMIPFSLVKVIYKDSIDWDRWHCNFYRCGGQIDDQYGVWHAISGPEPDFHQPLQFGQLNFLK